MNFRWLPATLAAILSILWSATALAQAPGWNFEVGTGVATTTGDISDRLTKGWNIDLGAGYEINETFELDGNFALSGLGVSDQVLQTLKVPDGNASLMALTVGPKIHFPISTSVRGYLVGGVGWYRRNVEFTQPTTAVIDIVDPWWGYLGSVVVPANQVLGSVTRNAWGVNGGGGVAAALGHRGAELFAEVRYHYADTNPTSTSIVPIMFGVRFTGQR